MLSQTNEAALERLAGYRSTMSLPQWQFIYMTSDTVLCNGYGRNHHWYIIAQEIPKISIRVFE